MLIFCPSRNIGERLRRTACLTRVRLGANVLTIPAVLLLAASTLKMYQLATSPVAENGLFTSRWFLIGLVEFEMFLGFWLLAGLLPYLSWAAALACFGIFTGFSLSKALSGDASCGCFGYLSVSPVYAASLDLAIVFSLLYWSPPLLRSPAALCVAFRQIELPTRLFRSVGKVVGVWLLVGLPVAFAMGSYTYTTLSDAEDIKGAGDIVVLKPATWLDKQFPLLDHIDIGTDLKKGRWLILLYHHDCPECRRAIPKMMEFARRSIVNLGGLRLALVEMPPYGKLGAMSLPSDTSVIIGRLREDKHWFVQAPLVQEISDSIVVQTDVLTDALNESNRD